MNNKRYISTSLSESFTEEIPGKESPNPFDKLSPQEFKIMQYLKKGDSVSEISKLLNLHTSTIGTHKSITFKKINCKNIVEMKSLYKVYKVIPHGPQVYKIFDNPLNFFLHNS
ncbi:MAG: LuxR C-terminal-related transcriptional regulator [Bacteroidota bacterium]|nr:LuxR C-terminal-related transcriptional regulator [Bacteroidota bacterium]MDQ6888884.1 LuxR C-terminal-related transcriptional regulator [Bacteroidota bacterium]